MTSVLEAIKRTSNNCRTAFIFRNEPSILERLFEPLYDCGIQTFTKIANGTNSLILATDVNPNIVFRATTEDSRRRNNIPFFLAGAYTHGFDYNDDNLRLELLLRGAPLTDKEQWQFLSAQMTLAGWNADSFGDLKINLMMADSAVFSIRGVDSRIKTVAMICDPSALGRLSVPADDLENCNVCGPDYPTLQDQAEAYNRIIANDEKLRKLVPEPIQFGPTKIIGETPELNYNGEVLNPGSSGQIRG